MQVPGLPQETYHSRAKEASTEHILMSGMEKVDPEVYEQWTPRGHSGAGQSYKTIGDFSSQALVCKSMVIKDQGSFLSCCFTILCFLPYEPR